MRSDVSRGFGDACRTEAVIADATKQTGCFRTALHDAERIDAGGPFSVICEVRPRVERKRGVFGLTVAVHAGKAVEHCVDFNVVTSASEI